MKTAHSRILKADSWQMAPSSSAPAIPDVASVRLAKALPSENASQRVPVHEPSRGEQVAELDRLREQARLEGLNIGRRLAAAEAKAIAERESERLAQLMLAIEAAWRKDRQRIEALISEFAFVAVNRLLAGSLRDPAVAIAAVNQTLAACASWKTLRLEVHPDEVVFLKTALSSQSTGAPQTVEVVAGDDVQIGGCRIRSSEGELDARLETQLAELKTALDSARAAWMPSRA